jgi:hypothetical protein
MDNTNEVFRDYSVGSNESNEFKQKYLNATVCITDKRVAQLLLVLHELDESVAGLEKLAKSDLSDLVSSAILACGFVDPIDARYAIASVLEAITAPDSRQGYS